MRATLIAVALAGAGCAGAVPVTSGPAERAPARPAPEVKQAEAPDNPWPESQAIRDDLAARYPRERVVVLLWNDRREITSKSHPHAPTSWGLISLGVVFGFANRSGHYIAAYCVRDGKLSLGQEPFDVDLDVIKAQREQRLKH